MDGFKRIFLYYVDEEVVLLCLYAFVTISVIWTQPVRCIVIILIIGWKKPGGKGEEQTANEATDLHSDLSLEERTYSNLVHSRHLVFLPGIVYVPTP